MNLTERAEIRKETFYKLTNSRDVPERPEGHRNYITNYATSNTNWGWNNSGWNFETVEDSTAKFGRHLKATCTRAGKYGFYKYFIDIAKHSEFFKQTMTWSMDVKTSKNTKLAIGCEWGNAVSEINTTENWQRFSKTFEVATSSKNKAWVFYGSNWEVGDVIYIRDVQLECGPNATTPIQAPEDLGWSIDPLVPTPDHRYLWKFEYIYYSDGSVENTQPVNISIAGADGTNGQTSHVHFAFADNATGGGFSLTTPKAYMGWYADFNETASNDPTKYKWGKWKGDQGAPGGKGDDGKTSYLHLAFASSADGKTGFSFTESGQQYQGYYTDFTQSSSTDPTKYTWMDRRAGVEVGGVNLLLYTADPWKAPNDYYQFNGVTKTDETLNGSIVYKTHTAWASLRSNWGKQLIDRKNVKVGDEFTYSIYAKTDQSSMKVRLFDRFSGQSGADALTGEITLTNEWQKLSVTFKVTQKMVASQSKLSWVGFEQVKDSEDGKFVYYACNMLEEGNTPTPWSPALEDTQEQIDSKADSALTQQQLNALAEQNSIVKAEMEAKASIDTVNQWITAYQNYVNANDEAKAESERNLQEASARILQLKTDVGTLRQQWDFIDTYMTVQNEGLIIGKSDGSAYAKFANDRISLFSGSSEVMYISQGVLRIENGIFTKTIQIGRFRFETHPADQDMLVLRYLGG